MTIRNIIKGNMEAYEDREALRALRNWDCIHTKDPVILQRKLRRNYSWVLKQRKAILKHNKLKAFLNLDIY